MTSVVLIYEGDLQSHLHTQTLQTLPRRAKEDGNYKETTLRLQWQNFNK